MKKGLPGWAVELYERLEAATSTLFVLHHNIPDYVPLGERFLSFAAFLQEWLGRESRIITYNRSMGLRFPDEETERRFREAVGLKPKVSTDPREAFLEEQRRRAMLALGEAVSAEPPPLPTSPTKVIPLLDQALRSGGLRDGRRRVVVHMEYAESIAPATDVSCMNEDDRTNLVALLRLSTDTSLHEKGGVILLTVGNLADLHPALRQAGSRVEVIEIPLPDEAERLQYIRYLRTQNGVGLTMTAEQFARATAGLTRLHLEQLWRQAKAKGQPLTYEEIKQRKREILRQELYGMVDLVEPSFGLEAIGGLDGVKRFFQEVIQALREGDLKMVPAGLRWWGPRGSGRRRSPRRWLRSAALISSRSLIPGRNGLGPQSGTSGRSSRPSDR